jgi:xylose dehydrogenase (NAD/NADP)
MADETLKWGIISTANIGRAAVIPAIQKSCNGQVVAVASRDEERARSFAARLDVPRAYGAYEALLAADDVDAVYIPLPNSLHREWTIKAAASGKHILCEKPLGLNAAECEEMETAARENNVVLMEAFMYRFHPRTERVLELVADGTIGRLAMIQSAFTFRLSNRDNIRLQPELGGGALMDVGCYCVNVSRTVAGAEPVEVQASAYWGETDVDEQLVGTLRFADNVFAQFDCALNLKRRETYTVAGADGYLEIAGAFLCGTADTTIVERHGQQEVITHKIPGVDEYQLMVEHFADCVLRAKPVRYPPSEAAANMRVIEALFRSTRNGGRPEKVASTTSA